MTKPGFRTHSKAPVEIEESVWTVIRNAGHAGLIVVEAAGNGAVNLDCPNCPECQCPSPPCGFPCPNLGTWPTRGDSLALIVGAGTSDVCHERINNSGYGARVDVHAWGENIFTLGFGTFWQGDPAHPEQQSYTADLCCTSGASAIVAGAAAAVQTAYIAKFGLRLTPFQMRLLLKENGIPQGTRVPGNIGPMVDVGRVMLNLGYGTDTDLNGTPDQCQSTTSTCPPVLAVGSRYLAIVPALDPNLGDTPIALRVVGDSPDVSCVSLFVQQPVNGRATLGKSPVCKTPAQWGTIFVYHEKIVPTTNLSSPTKYRVKALVQAPNTCTSFLIGQNLGTAPAEMWLWGDTNNDDMVKADDSTCIAHAIIGDFSLCAFYGADQMGCEPNGVIDSADYSPMSTPFDQLCAEPCP